jgi:type II secretory pathway pseudopilin PulG
MERGVSGRKLYGVAVATIQSLMQQFFLKKHGIQKRYLTFIEIMIVLLIMGITVGLIGVNVGGLIREQRYRSEVSLVVGQLRLAQDLMLILHTDAIVKFSQGPEGLHSWIEVENNLSKNWQREINRDRPPLTSFSSIQFEDASSGNRLDNQFDVQFLSGGSIMSRGVLVLTGQDKSLENYICLPGYPRPIYNVNSRESDPGCQMSNETDFAEKLTFYTRREIEDKEAKK